MKNKLDQVEGIRNPSDFKAVEQFYQEFHVASDYEIKEIVERHS
jgi:predicted phosphoribosyltransferase